MDGRCEASELFRSHVLPATGGVVRQVGSAQRNPVSDRHRATATRRVPNIILAAAVTFLPGGASWTDRRGQAMIVIRTRNADPLPPTEAR